MNKLIQLTDWFANKENIIVALSGGVDSGLVAYAAYNKLGSSAIAVTADYKTLSQDELNTSKKICSEIGIKQIIINYNELEDEKFVQNDNKRCFHCRTELSSHLKKVAEEFSINTIVDGTNLDDLGDYRPGITALRENGILSPLVEVGFTKKQIRTEAKNVGLSIFDKPSNSCLASRIPWGQRITLEKLTRIELGETFVKKIINAKQVRVRDMNGSAKIEVDTESIKQLYDQKTFEKIKSQLRVIGFSSVSVDPEGYGPGKINVIAD
jgi:uncharacterized protein